jgi:hypothetical protein
MPAKYATDKMKKEIKKVKTKQKQEYQAVKRKK